MNARTPEHVLADAASALVEDHDLTHALARLVRDCADVLGAQAVGLVVRVGGAGQLELLTATSHQMTELELFQLNHDEGPCVDAVGHGAQVSVSGRSAIIEQWPRVGTLIVEAGFGSVHAFPMHWRDQIFGALNVFSDEGVALGVAEARLGQAMADVATLLIVQQQEITPALVAERVRDSLQGRVVIERAKGVVAYTRDVDMARAYEILLETAASTGHSLTETAQRFLDETRARSGPDRPS